MANHLHTLKKNLVASAAFFSLGYTLAACGGASLPAPNTLTSTTAAILAINTNSAAIPGTPQEIYKRVAAQAAKCWFGPFGSENKRFMPSAEVPPQALATHVVIVVHRKLPDQKHPWGTALLRVKLGGSSITSLDFENVGLDGQTFTKMTTAYTHWANGGENCEPISPADPKPQPTSVTRSKPAPGTEAIARPR